MVDANNTNNVYALTITKLQLNSTGGNNMKRELTNSELKLYAAGKGVKLWQVADKFGITDAAFSRRMRKNFSEDDAAKFKHYVDEIASDMV